MFSITTRKTHDWPFDWPSTFNWFCCNEFKWLLIESFIWLFALVLFEFNFNSLWLDNWQTTCLPRTVGCKAVGIPFIVDWIQYETICCAAAGNSNSTNACDLPFNSRMFVTRPNGMLTCIRSVSVESMGTFLIWTTRDPIELLLLLCLCSSFTFKKKQFKFSL